MSGAAVATAGLAGATLALLGVRAALARSALARERAAEREDARLRRVVGPEEPVTVLQPIRSGDPLLGGALAENLAAHPDARFVWLVDEDDEGARALAADAAAAYGDRLEVVVTSPPRPGRNPKAAKLVVGLARAGAVVAVLDDDTVLPPGALARARGALRRGDLVTGLPVYREQGSLWSRLVAAFVNGTSLLTYLPMARVADPVTVNGMFVLTRRAVLEDLGGFRAIEDRLCDDYALARLYRAAGRRIVQTAVVVPLATTVSGPRAYARIMRRWMVFAREVLRGDPSPALVGLVVLPGVLPLATVLAAVVARSWPAAGAATLVLAASVATSAALRRRLPPAPVTVRGAVLEAVSLVVLPAHLAAATVRPGRVTWRGRRLAVVDGRVRVPDAEPEPEPAPAPERAP